MRARFWVILSLLLLVTAFQLHTAMVAKTWYRPAPETTWHYQLSGKVNTTYKAGMYDVDLFDVPQSTIEALHRQGKRVVCYFSAGSFEPWRADAESFHEGVLGKALEGWPDEQWVDIRSSNVRSIMLQRLDLARAKGCDGVEPDNVDGYDHESGFPLTPEDQLSFNRFLAREAHKRLLGIGLKNDLGQVEALVDDFDFSINEQCHAYGECDRLKPFTEAGKPVFNVEYAERYIENGSERENLCRHAQKMQMRTLVLPVALDDSFRYDCGEVFGGR